MALRRAEDYPFPMIPAKPVIGRIRSALKAEEKELKDLLDAIELNDAPMDAVLDQIASIEQNLRKIRQSGLRDFQ